VAFSIAIAGSILKPGEIAWVDSDAWTESDQQWVDKGLVRVLQQVNGRKQLQHAIPKRIAKPLPVAQPKKSSIPKRVTKPPPAVQPKKKTRKGK
jgi:hypothetical protein